MKSDFRWEPPHPANAQKVLPGNFPQFSTESCKCERSLTVRQKIPCPSFRNFPSSCHMLLQQRKGFPLSARFLQDFPHKAFGGLSVGFPHRCVQRIAAKVLENPVPLAGSQGRRVPRGPSTLQKLVRQTVGKQMLTTRTTENFLTGFRRGPLPGDPFSLVPIRVQHIFGAQKGIMQQHASWKGSC